MLIIDTLYISSMRGWFDILSYPGIVTAPERALLAVQMPLYLKPRLFSHQ